MSRETRIRIQGAGAHFEFRIMNKANFIVLAVLWLSPLAGQQPLTLAEAVQAALKNHPSLEAAAARTRAAEARIQQSRSGYMPKLTWQESFQSGTNPVYVFGSLLTQRQFTSANFGLQSLNRPDPLNNFQSLMTAEQLVYDFGMRKGQVEAAQFGKRMSEEDRRRAELALIAGAARAYHSVTLARESLQVAEEAVKSAEADLVRAEALRNAGLATEADVLAVRVHLAAMREQQITRASQAAVAQAALNEVMGIPLDTAHTLSTNLTAAAPPLSTNLEARAVTMRPEVLQARLAQQMAGAQAAAARSQLWPQFFLRGSFEVDRQQFANRGGGNWMFAGGMRWTLFEGRRAQENEAEARHMAEAARASERQASQGVQLEVRMAKSDFDAATERMQVGEASVAQAEESLRIIRNRYTNGLANITELLRAQTALLEARMRRLGAIYDQRLAAIRIELAAGVLNGDSDVLK